MAEQEVITSEKPQLTAEQMVVHDTGEYSMLFDSAKFNQAWRVANAFASSGLVPDHFKNNPAGVFVVLHMATRLALDPFMALQKVYMVHGRPGMEAQLVIALVNARGPFTGPIQWALSGEGKSRQCTAFATHAKNGGLCEATVTWSMVEAEGWSKKQGSKWLTIPDLMFRYRSATFLARLYCPEVILGLSTADELEDTAITLDSGVTVSHRPKVALQEAPEGDPAAVEEFARLVNEKSAFSHESLNNFIDQIAKVNKQTPKAVKAQASTPENFPTFWQSFLAWSNKHDKKPTTKPKEPPAREKATEAKTQEKDTATGATVGPRAASPEQLDVIRYWITQGRLNESVILSAYDVSGIDELHQEAANQIIDGMNA